MKTFTIISLILCIGLAACNESENNKGAQLIAPNSTYTLDGSQTIAFIDASKALVNENEFNYDVEGDHITFTYAGPLYIAIHPSKHLFQILSDQLIIEDLTKLQFFNGKEGENILIKN